MLSEKNISPTVAKNIFDQNSWLYAYGSIQGDRFSKFIFDQSMSKQKKQAVLNFKNNPPLNIIKSKSKIETNFHNQFTSHYFKIKKQGKIHLLILDKNYIYSVFKRSKLYEYAILNSDKTNFYQSIKDYSNTKNLLFEAGQNLAQSGTVILKDGLNNWITDIKAFLKLAFHY